MIGDNGCQASEVALAMTVLPIGGAEHPVKAHERRRGLLVGPRETTPIEVNLLEGKVVDDAAESTHHAVVHVARAFVRGTTYQVEVPTQHPWAWASIANVAQLLQKQQFVLVALGPVDRGEPPGVAIGRAHLRSHRVLSEQDRKSTRLNSSH